MRRDLTWNVLLVLFGLYVVQLLVENWLHVPLTQILAWWPRDQSAFRVWQPLTSPLYQSPSPVGTLITWVVLYLFLPTMSMILGARAVGWAAGASLLGAALLGIVLDLVGALSSPEPAWGIDPVLTGFFLLFGLAQPNARLMLVFVIPVQARQVAYGSGLLAFLSLLAFRSLDAATWLGGWVGAYLWFTARQPGGWRAPYLRWKHQRLQKKLRRFEVFPGGRDDHVH